MSRITRALLSALAVLLVLAMAPAAAGADAPAAGDVIRFGHFEQDNDPDNGPEPIEWIVLEVDEANRRVWVVSRCGLDAQPYHAEAAAVTWQTCTLREWLNGVFFDSALTEKEQAAVLTVEADNGADQDPWKQGGENTTDRVFPLSYAESRRFFPDREAGLCAPTDYAVAHGAYVSPTVLADGRAAGLWWFRTSGGGTSGAFGVPDGADYGYNSVNVGIVCVRPALCLDADALAE